MTALRTVTVIAALGVAATAAAGAIVADHAEDSGTRVSCSASSLPRGRAVRGLPPAVASMRLRMIAAARRCDHAALERLGNEVIELLLSSVRALAPVFESRWRARRRCALIRR